MGKTKLEQFIFTLMICFIMVLGMTAYNLILTIGFNDRVFTILFKELWMVFLIALFIDVVIISNTVKRWALAFIVRRRISSIPVKILVISTSMVLGMVFCMSLFGAVNAVGFSSEIADIYPRIVVMNLIAAWPLNIIIANPVARLIHSKVFQG